MRKPRINTKSLGVTAAVLAGLLLSGCHFAHGYYGHHHGGHGYYGHHHGGHGYSGYHKKRYHGRGHGYGYHRGYY